MASLEERKKAAESKFAHDAELRFKSEARRNKYLGHWAAEKIGRDKDEYAREVIKADFEEAGDEDVFRKLRGDLPAEISDDEIRKKMTEMMVRAADELSKE